MTPVIFRKWSDGEVVALFPTLPADLNDSCTSYQHIGQHGAAQYLFVVMTTKPVTAKEYIPLFRELQAIGYEDLRVYQKAQPWMHKERKSCSLV